MTITVSNRIGGALLPATNGATFERANPADRRQIVSIAPESSVADVTAAVDAAVDARQRVAPHDTDACAPRS